MELFSERYGLVKPQKAIIRNSMPEAVENSLCTLFDKWAKDRNAFIPFWKLEETVWTKYLNKRLNDLFSVFGERKEVIVPYIQNINREWNEKLDLVDYVLQSVKNVAEKSEGDNKIRAERLLAYLQKYINSEFERLHYGYRVVNGCITPLTSKLEIDAVEKATSVQNDPIRQHISQAIKLLSNRESPDYRNSIKEAISAVEVMGSELTGEKTLGRALDVMEKKGVVIHPQIREGIHKFYDYTNDHNTAIRHGLKDGASWIPSFNEAYMMLVACSAFVNYLREVKVVPKAKGEQSKGEKG